MTGKPGNIDNSEKKDKSTDRKIAEGAKTYAYGTDISPRAISGNNNKSDRIKKAVKGMPASNLKGAKSVKTVKDKSGKDRVKIDYGNGVKLRY